ncbi:MAG: flavodoxin family protein [Candidatus Bathyarchaeia archaeon]
MKVLGIIGSARKGGNTEILVSECLKSAESRGAKTSFLRLSELKISPCNGCGLCEKDGECGIEDDMQKVYQELLGADGIIVGSPVYFWTVSSYVKIFMDRTYALRYPTRRLKDKVGGAIVVASRRGGACALSTINNFFLNHEMIIGGLGVLGYARGKGEIMKDERAIRESREMGERIVELILSIKSKK